jgi:hypothetical protein
LIWYFIFDDGFDEGNVNSVGSHASQATNNQAIG